jgi:tetratricopeptide (TPR) repeat protein
VASYDRAIALRPDFVEIHYNRANALHQLGRLDEAVASYDRAIALGRTSPGVFNRGVALRNLRRFDRQLPTLTRTIALSRARPRSTIAVLLCRISIV